MSKKCNLAVIMAVVILISIILAAPPVIGASSEEPLYQRRNIFGMHNLKDGGPSIASGMEATRLLVGGGFVFDWVFDFEPWIEEAFKRNLIPCIRVQDGRGGSLPDPGYAGNVAWSIINYKISHPEYADRLVYLQLWNEPHDQRDKVEPDVYADYLVAAHSAIHQAEDEAAARHPELGLEGTFKTMTPGQNGPSWWHEAFSHNPDAKFAFDVWGTHPYPEATPPHYNLHDGDVFIETSKTIDSYLMDLDVVAMPHGSPPRSRRGFPVMITETAYGKKLGISYEGWPKTSRQMAADYNQDAFGNRWYRWPEIIAVHPFILSNWAWRDFEWIDSASWEDQDGDGIDESFSPYPQFSAVQQLRLDLEEQGMAPARLTPYRGPGGTIKGIIQRKDTGEPIPYATIFTDGYEFGHASLYDGGYEIHNVPAGNYTLSIEKNGYVISGRQITVVSGQTTIADFNLVYAGKVSRGIYFIDSFAGHSGCSGCDLFADYLGQTFTVPDDVGFIKYAACKPNVDGVTMKFSILEGGPSGPQVGSSITATLEPGDGAIMIGGEWPDGQEPAVEPGGVYFLRVERADGQGIYCFASDSNPYTDGNAYVAGVSRTGWDLYAVIRGLTPARNLASGYIAGSISNQMSDPIGQARVVASPGGYSTTSGGSGQYGLENIPTGTYSVTASKAGFASQTFEDIVVAAETTTFVDFELAETGNGIISGTVSGSAGNALSDALVLVTPGELEARTAADGTYLIPELNPDTYTLQVTRAGFRKTIKSDIRVNSGETTIVDFSLQPAPVATPRIVNPDFEADGGFFGVADGWNSFGGNKWESVWDPVRVFTQGIADIPPGEHGGVYQKISVTPGNSYRMSVYAKTSALNYEVAIGVDPAGGLDPDFVLRSSGSTSPDWTRLTVEFSADASEATVFLIAQNSGSWSYGNWAQFDGVDIEVAESDNQPPEAVASASPTRGKAPLTVQFDASASSDIDGDDLSYAWNFGDGSAPQSGIMVTHIFADIGTYVPTLTVNDGNGGTHTDTITITVEENEQPSNLIANGDFSGGLINWSVWIERGVLDETITASGQLQVQSSNHNGGLYQQFQTGGAGSEISISGYWASDPTVANHQWAEVLIINSDRQPVNGQDIHAGQSDVVMVFKNDTWAAPAGWAGPMAQTAGVINNGAFTAAGDTATIILKSGNLGKANSGMRFDNIVAGGSYDNHPPTAVASAAPTEGDVPLTVNFDAADSTDPDGDELTYSWNFGDGSPLAFEASVAHTYANMGEYTATLTVNDGMGAEDNTSIEIKVTDTGDAHSIYGITVHPPPEVDPGERWWELVRLHHLTCAENGGNHNLYTAFYYQNGSRVEQGWQNRVGWTKGDAIAGEIPLEKDETIGADVIHGSLDLYWNDNAALEYLNLNGEIFQIQRISGVHTRHPDECPGNTLGHHSFVAVYEERVAPEKPSDLSKLTIHTSFLGRASWEFIEQAQPAVVKILDEIKGEVTRGVKNISPRTRIVGRIWYDDRQRLGDGNPEARAQEWWENLKGTILGNPAVDYWEGYNEPVIHDADLMRWYARFEKKRIEILAANGHSACIGNFSTGMPPAERDIWEAFYPAIDAALANGGVLGLHEYSAPDMDWLFDHSSGEGWLTARYRKVYRQFLIPDGRVIPLIITECGIDGGVLGKPEDINRGWRSYQTPENYFEQLKWYDNLLKQDSYVLGATIFSLEIHNWGDFDIGGEVFEKLTDYVRSSRLPAQ